MLGFQYVNKFINKEYGGKKRGRGWVPKLQCVVAIDNFLIHIIVYVRLNVWKMFNCSQPIQGGSQAFQGMVAAIKSRRPLQLNGTLADQICWCNHKFDNLQCLLSRWSWIDTEKVTCVGVWGCGGFYPTFSGKILHYGQQFSAMAYNQDWNKAAISSLSKQQTIPNRMITQKLSSRLLVYTNFRGLTIFPLLKLNLVCKEINKKIVHSQDTVQYMSLDLFHNHPQSFRK